LTIIGYLVGGIIIGLLGKFVAPGHRDNIPLWLTVVCGIGGAVLGYGLFGRGDDGSFDWVAFIAAIAIAAVLVMAAAVVTGRTKKV
jgi:uncharacterized membrane protein YeaQ/YmgE (transglycosylase-associated protein family)